MSEHLTGYVLHLRASGATTGTLRVRGSQLRRVESAVGGDLLTATRAQLTACLAVPGWKPETRHSMRSAIRAFYDWAEGDGLVVVDPSRRLPVVRRPGGIPHPLPEAALVEALLTTDPPTRRMLLLGAYAGLRRSEIAVVHASEVSVAGLRITGKGGKTRVVPIHPKLAEDLDSMTGWAFPSTRRDGPVGPDYVECRVTKVLPAGFTCHSLRHRFASRTFAVTRDLLVVQQLLGHSKPETTARYVLIPDDSMAAAVAGI